MTFGRVADRDDHHDRCGQQRRPDPLETGHAVMRQPSIDRQREQQRCHHHGLDQQHRPETQRGGLQGESDAGNNAAEPPLTVAQQPNEQAGVADRFIGDPVRRPLMHDVTDCDEESGTQRQQGGDVRLFHARLSFARDPSLSNCTCKGMGTPRGDLFQ